MNPRRPPTPDRRMTPAASVRHGAGSHGTPQATAYAPRSHAAPTPPAPGSRATASEGTFQASPHRSTRIATPHSPSPHLQPGNPPVPGGSLLRPCHESQSSSPASLNLWRGGSGHHLSPLHCCLLIAIPRWRVPSRNRPVTRPRLGRLLPEQGRGSMSPYTPILRPGPMELLNVQGGATLSDDPTSTP